MVLKKTNFIADWKVVAKESARYRLVLVLVLGGTWHKGGTEGEKDYIFLWKRK